MGVDTKIRIPIAGRSVQERMNDVKNAIVEKLPVFGEATINLCHLPNEKDNLDNYDYHRILFALDYPCEEFESGKEQRMLSVYFDNYSMQDHMLYLSLRSWGHHIEIAKAIVDTFGGYADFYDCDEIDIDYAMPQPKVNKEAAV